MPPLVPVVHVAVTLLRRERATQDRRRRSRAQKPGGSASFPDVEHELVFAVVHHAEETGSLVNDLATAFASHGIVRFTAPVDTYDMGSPFCRVHHRCHDPTEVGRVEVIRDLTEDDEV